jgi:hypothetical protein
LRFQKYDSIIRKLTLIKLDDETAIKHESLPSERWQLVRWSLLALRHQMMGLATPEEESGSDGYQTQQRTGYIPKEMIKL